MKLRHVLSKFILFSTFVVSCAFAQSTLTQIQDTVYNTDGTLFNGTVIITWTGSANSSGSGPTPYSTSVAIANGALSVKLVPSTSANPPAYYEAAYNSSNGLSSWTETWSVPPSATPLNLSEVRVSSTTTSSSGGTITMSQVTGLNSYLGALTGSFTTLSSAVTDMNARVGTLQTTVANLSASISGFAGITTTANFIDGETPSGTVNGTNLSFTLSHTPAPSSSVTLYQNGVMLLNGADFSVSGNAITFLVTAPQSGDTLQAYYRITGTGALAAFADSELPTGTINGTNAAFTLANTPLPALSLRLYKNGALLQQGVDYVLSGANITFINATSIPQSGDLLTAYYRYEPSGSGVVLSLNEKGSVGSGGENLVAISYRH